jgi:hypothetical protein
MINYKESANKLREFNRWAEQFNFNYFPLVANIQMQRELLAAKRRMFTSDLIKYYKGK